MHPIKMTPAYRFGAMTPWGGSALRDVFGKDIPNERTGESLEAVSYTHLDVYKRQLSVGSNPTRSARSSLGFC